MSKRLGKLLTKRIPANNTHCTQLEAKETMGTKEVRKVKGP